MLEPVLVQASYPFGMPCYFCSDDPIVVAFIWLGGLLGIVYVGQLLLHLIDGTRTKATAPISINPADVLKSWVLYFVASLVVALYSGIVSCTDFIAAGGEPDPARIFGCISWVLKIIMLGLIGLFVGLFDYFCFAGKYARMRAASKD